MTFTPTDSTDYTSTTATATINVAKAPLTVTGITAADKVYDGNATATLDTTNPVLVGVVGSDDVTVDATGAAGTFADPNVADSIVVQVSGLTLAGTASGNYTLTQPTTTADITAAPMTVTGITAADKVYDGNATATLDTTNPVLVGVVGSDDVTVDATGAAGTFADPNVADSIWCR